MEVRLLEPKAGWRVELKAHPADVQPTLQNERDMFSTQSILML